MSTTLLIIHLCIALLMVGLILIQRSEGGGLGIGGASDVMGTRGVGNFLTRTTAWLAALFMLSSLLLTLSIDPSTNTPSIIDLEDDEGQIFLPPLDDIPPLPENDAPSGIAPPIE